MKRTGVLKAGAVVLACVGMLLPSPVVQAATAAGQTDSRGQAERALPEIVDVALYDGGTLRGQVVDVQGQPLPRTAVSIRQSDRDIATAVSNEVGYFRLTGLRGGMYAVVAGEAVGTCRLWAPNTAPPSAQPGALVVVGDEQVLGQGPHGGFQCSPRGCRPVRCYSPMSRLKYWLANPLVIAGIVATAVTIPVVIHNSKSSSK
ncbi:MAG: carboxypeptidase regulatory-like domain-containing protein [Planctomycetes bacterium]|nr:carboxypeptidase regulatory-like domain-containing protein [Planctomycetota bacterium]